MRLVEHTANAPQTTVALTGQDPPIPGIPRLSPLTTTRNSETMPSGFPLTAICSFVTVS